MGGLPTGVVSFVLTDVVGSTALWERAPEAMAAALARHDELVSEAIGAAGGTLLKPRGEGDSTFSVFTRASDAVRAAHRLQAAIRAEPWPADAVIRARVGVHTGEAVERDGDYLGPAVNRVARLRDVAHGGEIILSAATAAIVRAGLAPECELVDIGQVQLRGLDHAEPALVLAAPDLDPVGRTSRSTPSGRSTDVGRRRPDVFVGRDDALRTLVSSIEAAEVGHGVVVLVAGEPGIGKTRLVAEAAGSMRSRAPRFSPAAISSG